MTTLNAYATLAEFKDYARNRGGSVSVDSMDDAVIEILLKSASEYINTQTGRIFFPLIKTHYLDVPSADNIDPRTLYVDGDLLEVISPTYRDWETLHLS